MSSPEQQPQGPENNLETPKVSAELYEALDEKLEKKAERLESNETSAEKAKVEAKELALSVEAGSAEKKTKAAKENAPARRRGGISKKEKNAAYKKHMKQIQAELPPTERAFSKFIHTPVVEKTSEVIGSTVARPNAILSGAVVAFFLVLAVYLVAKTLGYVLSGFETIGAFIVGWVIGVLYDYFRVLITGKR
jgi:flagellar biosynthesis/type III secretory pathway protein FliH